MYINFKTNDQNIAKYFANIFTTTEYILIYNKWLKRYKYNIAEAYGFINSDLRCISNARTFVLLSSL